METRRSDCEFLLRFWDEQGTFFELVAITELVDLFVSVSVPGGIRVPSIASST